MGNDGGSIPTRRELVKEAARNPTTTELKETQKEQQAHRWSTCPISHKRLSRPVVSDAAGYLYNKDAVLQYLLPDDDGVALLRKEECEKFLQGRIKGLKDVVEVIFEEAEEAEKDTAKTTLATKVGRWICPVTSKALGPTVKAVYLVPCGHAVSQEAIREMKGDRCLQCDQTYTPENVIVILPASAEEKARLRARVEQLAERGLTHSLKKAPGLGKKRKANGAPVAKTEEAISGTTTTTTTTTAPPNVPKSSSTNQSGDLLPVPRSSNPPSGTSTPRGVPSSSIQNEATASLTAKVLEEEEARKKRRVLAGENENLKSLFSTSSTSGKPKKYRDGDFMTRGFSIPANARHQ